MPSNTEQHDVSLPLLPHKVWLVGGLLFLVLATAFAGYRTYRNLTPLSNEFDWSRRGLSDFKSMYGYGKAFRAGENPYSPEVVESPGSIVSRAAAVFSPFIFLAYVPFTWLGPEVAGVLHFVLHFGLLGMVAWLCLRLNAIKFDWALWIWIFGFLVISRPGHISLFTGYFTIQLVLGTLVAVYFAKDRPLLAAVGFLLASGKPTYGIPLTLLLLARRDYKAVFGGLVLSAAFAIGCVGWLAWHSDLGSVIEGVRNGQEAFHADETELPINAWTRVDAVGMFAKVINWAPGDSVYLASMFVLIALPCWVLWRSPDDANARPLSNLLIALAMLVTVYHHSYDCLLVCVACCGLLLNGRKAFAALPFGVSLLAGLLLAVPLLNYLSTKSVRDKLELDPYGFTWQSITMINGVCLLAALAVVLWYCSKSRREK